MATAHLTILPLVSACLGGKLPEAYGDGLSEAKLRSGGCTNPKLADLLQVPAAARCNLIRPNTLLPNMTVSLSVLHNRWTSRTSSFIQCFVLLPEVSSMDRFTVYASCTKLTVASLRRSLWKSFRCLPSRIHRSIPFNRGCSARTDFQNKGSAMYVRSEALFNQSIKQIARGKGMAGGDRHSKMGVSRAKV